VEEAKAEHLNVAHFRIILFFALFLPQSKY